MAIRAVPLLIFVASVLPAVRAVDDSRSFTLDARAHCAVTRHDRLVESALRTDFSVWPDSLLGTLGLAVRPAPHSIKVVSDHAVCRQVIGWHNGQSHDSALRVVDSALVLHVGTSYGVRLVEPGRAIGYLTFIYDSNGVAKQSLEEMD